MRCEHFFEAVEAYKRCVFDQPCPIHGGEGEAAEAETVEAETVATKADRMETVSTQTEQMVRNALRDEGVDPDTLDRDEDNLIAWWLETEAATLAMAIRKRRQYGSKDLELMGQAMEMMTGHGGGLEQALAFYALGKMARLFGAYERDEEPVIDSWLDLQVYSKMAQRTRENGSW